MSRREGFWADHLDEEGLPEQVDDTIAVVSENDDLLEIPRTQLASDVAKTRVMSARLKR